MFIRIKNIRKKGKTYKYACIVSNKWRKTRKEAKQKVKKYLGRVYFFDKVSNKDFFGYYSINDVGGYIKNNDKNKIIGDMIRFELINHGFKEKGDFLADNNIYFDKRNNELFVNKEKTNSGEINISNINNKESIIKIDNNKSMKNNEINSDNINKKIINKNKKSILGNNNIKNKKIVLAMNEGFFCNETISRLFGNFYGTEKEVGLKLANAFVEAGLKVPKEIFIGVFEKIVGR